jgi:preprotein translocase subunit SecG
VFFACTLLLAYFSHARPAGGGSLLERAAVGAPAAPASGAANEIPGAAAPNAPASAPAAPVSGAGQIPSK